MFNSAESMYVGLSWIELSKSLRYSFDGVGGVNVAIPNAVMNTNKIPHVKQPPINRFPVAKLC